MYLVCEHGWGCWRSPGRAGKIWSLVLFAVAVVLGCCSCRVCCQCVVCCLWCCCRCCRCCRVASRSTLPDRKQAFKGRSGVNILCAGVCRVSIIRLTLLFAKSFHLRAGLPLISMGGYSTRHSGEIPVQHETMVHERKHFLPGMYVVDEKEPLKNIKADATDPGIVLGESYRDNEHFRKKTTSIKKDITLRREKAKNAIKQKKNRDTVMYMKTTRHENQASLRNA